MIIKVIVIAELIIVAMFTLASLCIVIGDRLRKRKGGSRDSK